ncbi:MAG: MBL fold metallo-hydrolase [Jatrophihabitans sp.]
MTADTLTWLGHAGICLDLAGVRVLTDPVLRARVGPLRRHGALPRPETWQRPDVVLISHLHHDHLDLPSLRRIARDTTVVVPRGAGVLLPGWHDVREVGPGDEVRIDTLTISAVPAHHPGDRLGTSVRSTAIGYLIEGGPTRIWFAGDTGLFPGLRELHGVVDLALVPVGGWGPTLGPGHLDPRQAAAVAALVGARSAIPIHWGTLLLPGLRTVRPDLAREPGERFRFWATQVGVDARLLSVGAVAAIP